MLSLLLLGSAFAQDLLPAPVQFHLLGDTTELPVDATVYTAAAVVNVRAAPRPDAAVERRLVAGTRARVVEDLGAWVEIRVGGATGFVARELVSTMGRATDLDGDGVEERVVVQQGLDGATRAWLREGERVQHVVVYAEPDPYMGSWDVVPAAEAGVALLRVSLDQDRCGAYPSAWLSYADDTLRTALSVESWGDGGYGHDVNVRFVEPGLVSVKTEVYGEVESVVTERACRLTQGVYHCS